jgi:hypothetical protein
MSTGADLYAAARRRAQTRGRRPAEPQSAPGQPGSRARVRDQARPCRNTRPAGGPCGHSGLVHLPACSVIEVPDLAARTPQAAQRCGCPGYKPEHP